jgi:hypothetical protein
MPPRRSLIIGAGAALLAVNPMWLPRVRQVGADYAKRLLVRSLAADLRAGKMQEPQARRMVMHALANGWL